MYTYQTDALGALVFEDSLSCVKYVVPEEAPVPEIEDFSLSC